MASDVATQGSAPAPQPTGWVAWAEKHNTLVLGGIFVGLVGGIAAAEILLGKAERHMGGGR